MMNFLAISDMLDFVLSLLLLLENLAGSSRHQRTLWRAVLTLEIVTHLTECHPLDSLVGIYVFYQPEGEVSQA
jgi:hypothetical protein